MIDNNTLASSCVDGLEIYNFYDFPSFNSLAVMVKKKKGKIITIDALKG